MSNCALDFAYSNEEACYAVLEDTCGTLKKPAAANQLYTVGPVAFNQQREKLEDEQIRASASQFASIRARKQVGTFSCRTYVKPSGVLGTPPEHRVFLTSLLGEEDVQATYVDYKLASQLSSFSLWVKKGHTVFAMRGAVMESGEFGVAGDAISGINFNGKFMEQLWAGECYAADTCGIGKQTIQLTSGGAQRYCAGMYVVVGTDDNSDAGYKISSVNYNLDQITLDTTLVTNQGTNPLITPWWPAAGTEVGEPSHGKLGLVTIDGANAIIMSAGLTITNNAKFYENEKNGVWTAERFGRPGKRAVEGNLMLYFLKAGLSYFYRADYNVTDALVIPSGDVSGKIMEISVPYAEYNSPEISGDEEFQENIPYKAIASAAGNDEVKIRFK